MMHFLELAVSGWHIEQRFGCGMSQWTTLIYRSARIDQTDQLPVSATRL